MGTFFLIFCPFLVGNSIFVNYDLLKDNMAYRVKYSILVQGFISKKNITTLLFYPLYLIRRLFCAAVLVFLPERPVVQLSLICFSSVIVKNPHLNFL